MKITHDVTSHPLKPRIVVDGQAMSLQEAQEALLRFKSIVLEAVYKEKEFPFTVHVARKNFECYGVHGSRTASRHMVEAGTTIIRLRRTTVFSGCQYESKTPFCMGCARKIYPAHMFAGLEVGDA